MFILEFGFACKDECLTGRINPAHTSLEYRHLPTDGVGSVKQKHKLDYGFSPSFSRCWMHICRWTDAGWPSTSLPLHEWSHLRLAFNPLLFPSSLIPSDGGPGTTNTQGLEGPFSWCHSFTCMGARAHVDIYNCVWCEVSDLRCSVDMACMR